MLGFAALGEAALGEGGDLTSKFVTCGFAQPMRKAGLTAAVVATTVVGFVPQQVSAAPVFTTFSEPLRRPIQPPAWGGVTFVASQPGAVFSTFTQPLPARVTLADEQPSALFEVLQPQAVPFAGFSTFSHPVPARAVLPDEQPSALFEFLPVNIPFVGFCDFGIPRFARFSFADQQTLLLFERFIPPEQQGGGTSRKLDFSEPAAEAPRRKKKTGLEPISKAQTQPLIEPPKPALPLPPFEPAPEAPLDKRSPFDLVDRALIPQDLLGLQAQIHAAQAAYLDEQDARDIADIAALLDRLDEEEA